ncbi:antibiotic biosynthesis monooxygenase [Sulfurifustis variabilis]|uniref:Antibiotic biosynthesis monooxygenase n=1 Tax=Sulfurifustis variabilis TaxID=1675686 RepID=A0A1B4V512_9GAMM|nr:antibiotic biosynthesis monooxygenase [Sulfurifustis variabilis]BAU47632.1 antibiotic biosynthesis monooxygenase [Sulfurifustis variabilis]
MQVSIVYVHIKPERVSDFIEATRRNHEGSVREPGNLRFDVLQSASDPTRFMLYEAYVSAEQAAAHKQTAHYLQWRETVADWMASPRHAMAYDGLFPRGP